MRASRLVVGCSLLLVPSSLFAIDAATARAAELWALARATKGGSAPFVAVSAPRISD